MKRFALMSLLALFSSGFFAQNASACAATAAVNNREQPSTVAAQRAAISQAASLAGQAPARQYTSGGTNRSTI